MPQRGSAHTLYLYISVLSEAALLQRYKVRRCHAVNPSMGAPLRHPCLRGAALALSTSTSPTSAGPRIFTAKATGVAAPYPCLLSQSDLAGKTASIHLSR